MLNIRTATERKYICESDDAVDHSRISPEEWASFQAGDVGIDKVPIRDGFTPSVFSLHCLSVAQWNAAKRVEEAQTFEARLQEAVRYGLVGWQDFVPAPLKTTTTPIGERMDDATFAAIFVPRIITELGIVILKMSDLGPTRGPG